MEVIRISRERIKIMLTSCDMDEMNINCDMLEGLDRHGKEAFTKIMQEARERCGFISCGKKIFVQIFPSKDGGCEMFITKLNDAELVSIGERKKKYYYRFETMNELLGFCSGARSYNIRCSVYRDVEKGSYYIECDDKCNLCGEYGGRQCNVASEAYIAERCSLICEDAVGILGRLG